MSKKSILNTLLISSALLGATVASAATSDIKSESKKVTVCTDKAKLYKDSKLKESTTPKNGTVYQVNGYRDINGKHVYRVYQTDKNGKQVYRGYIDKKDTKDFNGQKASGQYVAKKGSSFWANFYWTEKKASLSEDKVVFAKYEYTLGNGRKYYSMYTKDAAGKDVWQGYTTKSNLSDLKSTTESKYITLNKNTKSFANLYFQQTKGNFDASKGVNFKVTRYYTIGGKKYYSTEQNNGWTGYVDASVVSDLKAEKVADADSKVQVVKEWNTYSNHFFTKKDQLKNYKGKTLTQKYIYTYGNGKKYASLYDGDTWLGYANVEALKVVENKPKPEAPKPTEDEVKALQDAVEKAKKVVAAENNLNGVEPVKQALEKAEKILKDENKTQKDVVDATKAINDAINKITLKPSQNEEAIKALHAAIEQLKETQKLGADNLVNNEKYNEVLTSAEKVLENAVAGKADKAKIDAETTKVNNFINGLKLNTEALKQKIEAVKAQGDKVYMTKEQENKFNKFIEDAKTAASNDKLSNTDKLKEIDAQLKKAEDFIKEQPTEADVQKLIDATKKEQEVVDKVKGHESEIFQNWDTVTAKDAAADKMLKEIKEDKSPQENNATVEHTAKDVQDAAKALMDSMANLEVNHDNLQKYYDAANAAIKELDPEHEEKADALLKGFAAVANNADVNYLTQMVNAAKSLNKEIHDDQVEEIDSIIAKVKRIEGNSQENKKFYESVSYEKMDNELGEAESAATALKGEKVTTRTKRSQKEAPGVVEVTNGKNASEVEKKLKQDVKDLQVKDWNVKEVDGKIQLVDYKGNYEHSTADEATKNGDITIEIPGSLKDEQVVINTTEEPLFAQQNKHNKNVTIKFEKNTERKVVAEESLKDALYNNKNVVSIDASGLDTSKVKDFSNAFSRTSYLKTFTGLDTLVGSSATNLRGMLAGANLATVDVSKWDTSKVTDMSMLFSGASKLMEIKGLKDLDVTNVNNFNNMFGATRALQSLDFSNWNMEHATSENTKKMFLNSGETEGTNVKSVTLPNEMHGVLGNGPKLIVEALEFSNKKYNNTPKYTNDIEVKRFGGEKVGTVKKDGTWEADSKYSKENVITEDKEVLNNPVALCNTLMHSEKLKDNDTVKNFAKFLNNVAYPVWMYSTGNKVISSRDMDYSYLEELQGEPSEYNAGLQHNKSWDDFEKQGSGHYYKAIQLLQEYAKNAKTDKNKDVEKLYQDIVDDMTGMRVVPTKLQEAMEKAEKVNKEAKDNGLADKIAEAKSIVDGKDSARLNLENWQHIVELTKDLTEGAKKEQEEQQNSATEQKGDVITKDQATLKSAPALARAILTSDKTSEDAKELAEVVKAAYEVDKNSTGDYEKSISKIDINKSWTEFGGSGDGSYYDALKDLQDYARNTASVSDEKLQKAEAELVDDMEGLRVLPDYLDAAMKEAQKAEKVAKAKNVEVESTEQLIQDAKVIVEGKNDARRGLDNWKHINELTAKLKEAAKKLTTIVKK